jgi:hypothetical protein
VSARQALILLLVKNQMLRPTAPTATRRPSPERSSLGENAPRRVGAEDCSSAPLTEPDLRASHTALWIDISEWQHKLP